MPPKILSKEATHVYGKHQNSCLTALFSCTSIDKHIFCLPSHCTFEPQDTAAAAIFLASKVEEFRVHIKDVMMVTYKIRHKNERKLVENSDVSYVGVMRDISRSAD